MEPIRWFAKRSLENTIAANKLQASQMVGFVDLLPQIDPILNNAAARVAAVTTDNRVSVDAVGAAIGDIIRDGYTLFHRTAEASGSDLDLTFTKASVLLMVDEFYKNVVAPLDIPWVPNIAENAFVDPLIGKWVHGLVSAIYDSIVAALNAIPPAMLGTASPSGPGTVYTETRPVHGALAPNPMEQAESGNSEPNDK